MYRIASCLFALKSTIARTPENSSAIDRNGWSRPVTH
jgi:hypothetical protein